MAIISTPTGAFVSKSDTIKIGIGAGIGGLALGLVVSLVLWLRRFFRRRSHDRSVLPVRENGDLSSATPGATTMVTAPMEMYLWQGRSDGTFDDALYSGGAQIERHVRYYYHRNPVGPISDALDKSLEQHCPDKDTRSRLVELVMNQTTRPAAIRHLLARVIFLNLDFDSVNENSLLPSVVKSFIPTLREFNKDRHNAAGNHPIAPFIELSLISLANLAAKSLNYWKRTTAWLMDERAESLLALPLQPPLSLKSQITELVNTLNFFFEHFAKKDAADPQLKKYLEDTIWDCARFGYELFNDPCDWRFTFESPSPQQIVVVPGLERWSDRDVPYTTPLEVVRPQTEPVDI
jgi:hypothetical protein